MRTTASSLLHRASRWAARAGVALSLLSLVALGLGPHTGTYRTLTVLTGSMNPGVPPGSVVFVAPVEPRDVSVGDVLTYRIPVEDRRVITHRVIEVVEAGPTPVIRTKGDANDSPDPWLARLSTSPAWRVRLVVPKAGYVLRALRHEALRHVSVVLVPALLALSWGMRIWRPAARRPPVPT